MITGIVLLIFLGSFALYNTSKKAVLNNHTVLGKWIQDHSKKAKIIGIILILFSLILTCLVIGIMSGFLFWLITLMIILSLLIIFAPLQIIKYKHLLIVFSLLSIVELLLHL